MPNNKLEQFRALHVRGNPLILFNIWDAGSAKAVTKAGAKAIATGSWSVANASGYEDGERLPIALAIENLRRIARATDLPVTIDLESGYGDTPEAVGDTIRQAIAAGAVGCNLEDSFPADGTLRDMADQVERIRAARRAADAVGGFFLNVRTDIFLQPPRYEHNEERLADAIERGRAYADAGGDGLFAPGLVNIDFIAQLAEASRLPLNIMMSDATPPVRVLAQNGVARVSHGPGPYRLVMKALEESARAAVA